MPPFQSSTTVLDSILFRDAFGTPGMRQVFSDKAFIARTKAEQRAWLEQRDHDCAAAARRVSCLAAAYEARMKVFVPAR